MKDFSDISEMDPLKIETPSTTNTTALTSTTSATTTVNSSPMVSISKNSNLETELDLGTIHDPISIKTEVSLLEKTLVQKDKKDNTASAPPKKDKMLLTPPSSQGESKSPKIHSTILRSVKKVQKIREITLHKKKSAKKCNLTRKGTVCQ